jgi:hypothetical protein
MADPETLWNSKSEIQRETMRGVILNAVDYQALLGTPRYVFSDSEAGRAFKRYFGASLYGEPTR